MQIVKFNGDSSNIDLMRSIHKTDGAKLIKYISYREKAVQPKVDEDDYKARYLPKGPKTLFSKKLLIVGQPVINRNGGVEPDEEEIIK